MQINLKDKIVLVTGASSGIGEAVAKSLAAAQATVAIHYHSNWKNALKMAQDFGNKSKAFKADLELTNECNSLFFNVLNEYGKIDILINNAGVFLHSPIEKDEDWDIIWERTMNINLKSTAILCKEAIRYFKRHGGGRIINIASRAAFRGDTEDYLAYAASKGGMVALTRSIARSCGKDNIKAFVVAPGFVNTKMAQDFIRMEGEESVTRDNALPVLSEPADIAPTILFLASGYMDHATGCSIDVNAGSYVR